MLKTKINKSHLAKFIGLRPLSFCRKIGWAGKENRGSLNLCEKVKAIEWLETLILEIRQLINSLKKGRSELE